MVRFSVLMWVLMAACASPVEVVSNLCIIPDSVAQTSTVTADQLSFPSGVAGSAASCKVGDVVVSGYNRGYIRTITAISATADALRFTTKQADLTDAVKNGKAHWVLDVARQPQPTPVAGTSTRSEALGTGDLSSGIDLTGTTVYSDANTTVTITHGRIKLDASAIVNADVAHNDLNRFDINTAGNVDADLAIKVDSTQPLSIDRSREVWSGHQLFFELFGPVPVVIVAEVSVEAGAAVSLDCGVSSEIGAHITGGVTGGIHYDGTDWTEDGTSTLSADPIGPTMDRTVNVSIKPYLKIKVGYKFYGLVGPFAELQPYGLFTAQLAPDPQWTLHAGASLTVGFETAAIPFPVERPGWLWAKLKGLLDKISARTISTELWSFDTTVASQTLGMGDTIGCNLDGGAGDMSRPPDLAGADMTGVDLASPSDLASLSDLSTPTRDLSTPPETCGQVRVSGEASAYAVGVDLSWVFGRTGSSYCAVAGTYLDRATNARLPVSLATGIGATNTTSVTVRELSPGVIAVDGSMAFPAVAEACNGGTSVYLAIDVTTEQAGPVEVDFNSGFASSVGVMGPIVIRPPGYPENGRGGSFAISAGESAGAVSAFYSWYPSSGSRVTSAPLPAGHHVFVVQLSTNRFGAAGSGRMVTLRFPCGPSDGGASDQAVPIDFTVPPDLTTPPDLGPDLAVQACSLGDGFGLPPSTCQAGSDPVSSAPYLVCQADCFGAWLSATGVGVGATFRPKAVCNQLGYSGYDLFGKNCGSVCGTCGTPSSCASQGMMTFDADPAVKTTVAGAVVLLGNQVTWHCSNGPLP